jgi:hypothetical protein
VFALAGPGDGLAALQAGPGFACTDGNAISPNEATVTPAAWTALTDEDSFSGARLTPDSGPTVDWFFASSHRGLLLDEWAEGLGPMAQLIVPDGTANKLA